MLDIGTNGYYHGSDILPSIFGQPSPTTVIRLHVDYQYWLAAIFDVIDFYTTLQNTKREEPTFP